MTRERLTQSSLPEVISDTLNDFADLFRKELQLDGSNSHRTFPQSSGAACG
jgi:hypothetical protein